ncbi:CYFIP-related Rac1 interactor B-like isoform X2 [Tubulanus polymorphus]|uniref:CYFIP-related Rac1 interactor B-like isoform X2 n=1 Tax=Tubulanus polymorphus TaxID=672921 RepID=UPI003DA48477
MTCFLAACGPPVMGNLLKVLSNKEESVKFDVFVDFENCKPTESEIEVWEQVESVLTEALDILNDLQHYKGASNEIKDAISNPKKEELQEKAWLVVFPLVSKLKRYFEFSIQFESIISQLLGVLCNNEMTSKEHLESQQALFKQFAQILDFTMKFDDLKMTIPAIQNDFSFYRRTLSRMKMANEEELQNLVVSNEMANHMSLFYAHATPMLKVLSDTTTKFVAENKDLPVQNTTDCLSTMANICRTMLENPKYSSRFQNEETYLFCFRVMVGVIILYDHVHPVGAFARSSNIDMKATIKLIKDQPEQGRMEALLNALRYTTRHLNDETTSKTIRNLLQL